MGSLVRSACLLFSMLAEMVSYRESPPINSLYGKYKTIECTKFSFFMFLLISPLMNRFYPSVVATLMSHIGQIPSKILILLGFDFVVLANHDKKQVLLSQNGVLSSPRQKTQVQDEKIKLQSVSLDCCSIPLNSCLIAARWLFNRLEVAYQQKISKRKKPITYSFKPQIAIHSFQYLKDIISKPQKGDF